MSSINQPKKFFTAEEVHLMIFGSLIMWPAEACSKGSHKKVPCFCIECGKFTSVAIPNLFNGHTTSCGRCNEVSAEEMAVRKFGRLMQKVPKATMPGSGKTDEWACDCGQTASIITHSVFSGYTVSCGNCSFIVKQWYQNNKTKIKKVKTPVKPEHLYDCPIIFLDVIVNTNKPVPALCPACKNTCHPRWSGVRQGKSLTCGCVSSIISRQAMEISKFIKSLGSEFKTEF
jgi:hypothetical protein